MPSLAWHLQVIPPEAVRRLWPLAWICEPGAAFDGWCREWQAWLAAADRTRLAMALSPPTGRVPYAAWMAELVPQDPGDHNMYLVMRLWLVEPALPGRVLSAWFGCLPGCAREAGCRRVEVPRAALPPPLWELAQDAAARAGFEPGLMGWHAKTDLPYHQAEPNGMS